MSSSVACSACRTTATREDIRGLLAAVGVDLTQLPRGEHLFCADTCIARLPETTFTDEPVGKCCWKCRTAADKMRESLNTLKGSREEGAWICRPGDDRVPGADQKITQRLVSRMVAGSATGGGVRVPLIGLNMRLPDHRECLQRVFEDWMTLAAANPRGSAAWSMATHGDVLHTGITDTPHIRAKKHANFAAQNKMELLGMLTLVAGVMDDKNGCWEDSAEGLLRTVIETKFPEREVRNDPRDDMKGLPTPARGLMEVKTWNEGGREEHARMMDMTRKDMDAERRGSGIVKLVSQLAWGNPGTVLYVAFFRRLPATTAAAAAAP